MNFTTETDSSPWTLQLQDDPNSTLVDFFQNGTSSNRTSGVERFYPLIVTEMVLSVICLVFSIYVYTVLPEFRNVHGKNLISLSGCMLASFSLLTLDILFRKRLPRNLCYAVAAVVHVTFLATFFWTNVMAFDIYRTFADLKPRSEVKSRSKRYLKYSLYAWCATGLVALPAAVLDSTDLVPAERRPRFGEIRCWLNGTTAFVLYFNFPVGVILLSNLVMFLLTVRKLLAIKKMTEVLRVEQQKKRLHLYLKLFLVMGITWFTEFLPWATGVYALYALAGMLTAMHGILLFAIFVAKKKIIRQVRERWRGDEDKASRSQPSLSTTANSSTKM